jgi:hypothetical protein
MKRLSAVNGNEKFRYQGKIYTLDSSGVFSNRQVPVVEIATGERSRLPGKTEVEIYTETEQVEEPQVENTEVQKNFPLDYFTFKEDDATEEFK